MTPRHRLNCKSVIKDCVVPCILPMNELDDECECGGVNGRPYGMTSCCEACNCYSFVLTKRPQEETHSRTQRLEEEHHHPRSMPMPLPSQELVEPVQHPETTAVRFVPAAAAAAAAAAQQRQAIRTSCALLPPRRGTRQES